VALVVQKFNGMLTTENFQVIGMSWQASCPKSDSRHGRWVTPAFQTHTELLQHLGMEAK
jgi:hypothetical protein